IQEALEAAWAAYDENYYRQAVGLAQSNTWERRIEQISTLIEEGLAAPASSKGQSNPGGAGASPR
ncbi:MAG: hypothetical protein GX878_02190, partial [Firmicutes bacterium]|nr:hypothetical protein [Bacillota bacterium]